MNTNNTISVPSAMLDQVVHYVEVSSLLGKRALDEVEVHRQSQKRASDLRGPLLDYMVEVGVVSGQQKEAAAAMLGSHAETLQLLKAAVDKLAAFKKHVKTAGDEPGQAVDAAGNPASNGAAPHAKEGSLPLTKEGEYDSLNDPFVGRHTSFIKESDRKLLAGIGK